MWQSTLQKIDQTEEKKWREILVSFIVHFLILLLLTSTCPFFLFSCLQNIFAKKKNVNWICLWICTEKIIKFQSWEGNDIHIMHSQIWNPIKFIQTKRSPEDTSYITKQKLPPSHEIVGIRNVGLHYLVGSFTLFFHQVKNNSIIPNQA